MKDKQHVNASMQLEEDIINSNSTLGLIPNKVTQLILNIGNEHRTTWGLYNFHVRVNILVI